MIDLGLGTAFGAVKAKVAAAIGLVLLLALIVGVLWYGEWRADAEGAKVKGQYEAAIQRQKATAEKRLREEMAYSLGVERELAAAKRRIEEVTSERETIAAGYERRLAAAATGGRLRDPNAAGCRGGGGGAPAPAAAPAVDRAEGGAQAGGLLSLPLSDLLRRIVREAQEQSDAYAACRVDAMKLREQLSPP